VSSKQIHILKSLSLPDRFENLRSAVGDRVAELLVQPSEATLGQFRRIGASVAARREGFLAPLSAPSGAGKTTLANMLTVFLPEHFAPTLTYVGPLDYDAINRELLEHRKRLKADDRRVVPVNIDHRESAPPDDRELASIKRSLRAPSAGASALLLWPETNPKIAKETSKRFTDIAGQASVPLPLTVGGPPQESWSDITLHTLQLVNAVQSVEELGIDPRDYEAQQFETLGAFMRQVSNDFTALLEELVQATKKPINLVVTYVSESANAGVLSQLTSGTKYGLFDSHALLGATPSSVIGKWWAKRKGLLTQTILRLNARGFCLPPAATVAVLRAVGPTDVQGDLDALGVRKYGGARLHRYLSRTDIGKYLAGADMGAYEARGRPADDATAAMASLAERGFTYGKDKSLNQALLEALKDFLEREGRTVGLAAAEEKLEFAPVIPDNQLHDGEVICIEYTWRSGDFLQSSRRSEVAKYALEKLKSYAVALGWAT